LNQRLKLNYQSVIHPTSESSMWIVKRSRFDEIFAFAVSDRPSEQRFKKSNFGQLRSLSKPYLNFNFVFLGVTAPSKLAASGDPLVHLSLPRRAPVRDKHHRPLSFSCWRSERSPSASPPTATTTPPSAAWLWPPPSLFHPFRSAARSNRAHLPHRKSTLPPPLCTIAQALLAGATFPWWAPIALSLPGGKASPKWYSPLPPRSTSSPFPVPTAAPPRWSDLKC
jgi:hypothetical protein